MSKTTMTNNFPIKRRPKLQERQRRKTSQRAAKPDTRVNFYPAGLMRKRMRMETSSHSTLFPTRMTSIAPSARFASLRSALPIRGRVPCCSMREEASTKRGWSWRKVHQLSENWILLKNSDDIWNKENSYNVSSAHFSTVYMSRVPKAHVLQNWHA